MPLAFWCCSGCTFEFRNCRHRTSIFPMDFHRVLHCWKHTWKIPLQWFSSFSYLLVTAWVRLARGTELTGFIREEIFAKERVPGLWGLASRKYLGKAGSCSCSTRWCPRLESMFAGIHVCRGGSHTGNSGSFYFAVWSRMSAFASSWRKLTSIHEDWMGTNHGMKEHTLRAKSIGCYSSSHLNIFTNNIQTSYHRLDSW